ncbi:hypothetical protein COLO4_28336 [Corchorus olitorius]|uniref:Uncharacterized protein n=1 Tax=Corchorus olitorius TaxID=93759 RepID=A0A1R3HLT0_9ROSI|nr:hypothetical protein COLO4_28336 [Corchorus olitorius]
MADRTYITLGCSFLFICTVVGGSCLVASITLLAESQSSKSLLILGFTLICMHSIKSRSRCRGCGCRERYITRRGCRDLNCR